jgi:hypothetical protein
MWHEPVSNWIDGTFEAKREEALSNGVEDMSNSVRVKSFHLSRLQNAE